MKIVVRLDRVMADRKVNLKDLALDVGLTESNLSKIKNSKIKAIRMEVLENLCKTLKCQPGDLFEYVEDDMENLL